ncbi:MAG: glycosyltransferase family 4 protein [Gemmatimonadetes bacterium]|nr:glycosyltransferase family 4 protein [Gemmatimonadota bacterium]
MKVLHVVTAFPRHDDDVITPWLGRVLLGLRAAGIDAQVLAPAYAGAGATEWRGIPVHRFRYAPARLETLTHDETVPDRLRARPWYASLLPGYIVGGAIGAFRARRFEPDVVHVHWPVPHAVFGAICRAATDGSAALVCSYYSVEVRWIERRMRWVLPFLRWSIGAADAVTAISSSTARAIEGHGASNVHVIPFAAGLAVDDAGPDTPRAGGAEGAGAQAPDDPTSRPSEAAIERGDRACTRVLFVGRLVQRKGVDVLLHALRRLRHRLDVRADIVGDGAWAPRIRETIRSLELDDIVAMRGRVGAAELVQAYRAADLFVLPAVVDDKGDTEGLGVVLLEALRAGLPVIGSEVGGIPDIVVDGETGWLVPPDRPDLLAKAIEDVSANPAEARRRVAAGNALIERTFTLDSVLASLRSCYDDAVRLRRESRS